MNSKDSNPLDSDESKSPRPTVDLAKAVTYIRRVAYVFVHTDLIIRYPLDQIIQSTS